MRTVLLAALYLFLSSPAMAEETAQGKSASAEPADKPSNDGKFAKNAINVELGGLGLLYSFNYERKLMETFGIRAGFMYFGLELDSGELDPNGTTSKVEFSLTMIPLAGTYLLKSEGGSHSLELGGGLTPVIVSASASVSSDSFFAKFGDSATVFILNSTIGYRYEPFDGGFQFRIGLNPQYLAVDGAGFITLPYLSLGGAF